jgi:aerobic-type carbon monoxide dehydrogenase small subunit (CoxS/CutS family)
VIEFLLNGETVTTDSPADTPLLWVIRDELKLKGTKFGCGIALCGACTVHIDGAARLAAVLRDVAERSAWGDRYSSQGFADSLVGTKRLYKM